MSGVACLGIDTATVRGSIALARAGRLLAEAALEERAPHARELLDRIERLLRDAGLAAADLAGIGVLTGPGSFTGVRIGMATGKGMAWGLGIPVLGLSSLLALALAAVARGGAAALCPVLQAGRGELYAALFAVEQGGLVRLWEDRAWRPAELVAGLDEGTVLVGDGVAAALEAAGAAGRRLGAVEPSPSLAGAIALRAAATLRPGSGYAIGSLAPNYIRPTDAEAARPRT